MPEEPTPIDPETQPPDEEMPESEESPEEAEPEAPSEEPSDAIPGDEETPTQSASATADTRAIPVAEKEDAAPATFDDLLNETTPYIWVTQSLFFIYSAVFIILMIDGMSFWKPTLEQMLAREAHHGPFTFTEHLWRIATHAFVHAGFLQLALTLWCLVDLGRLAERLFGNAAYIILIVLSSVGAAVAGTIWDPMTVTMGAAGTFCGIFGALIAFALFRKGVLPRPMLLGTLKSFLPLLVWNIFIALDGWMTHIPAMIGGLVTGFVTGACLSRSIPAVPSPVRYVLSGVVAAALAGATLYAQARVRSMPDLDEYTPQGRQARRLYNRAMDRLRQEDRDEALDLLDRALKLNPKLTTAYIARSWIHITFGESDKAIEDCTKALERNPGESNAYFNRAEAYRKKLEFAKAIEDYSRAIELRPDYSDAYYRRGWCHDELKKYFEAIGDYTKVIEFDSHNVDALRHRAHARYDQGDYRGAIEDYMKVIEMVPTLKTELDPRIQSARNKLKKE